MPATQIGRAAPAFPLLPLSARNTRGVLRGLVLAALGLAAAANCGGDALSTPGPHAGGTVFLRAAVTSTPVAAEARVTAGVPGDTYEGTGEFGANDPNGARGPSTFSIISRATDGRGERSFSVVGAPSGGTGRFEPGDYAIATPNDAGSRSGQVTATYSRVVDGWMEAYVGRAGTLTVTTSSPERVAGTFRFTGVRYYRRPVRGTGGEAGLVLGRPDAVPPDQPAVDVAGTFAAAPWRADGVIRFER